MQIPVNQIVNVEPNNYQGLTKTTFLSSASQNQPVYMFHQPQNSPQVGMTLDGTLAPDKSGKLKFTKTPNPQYNQPQGYQQNNYQQSQQARPQAAYKADPAKQDSIEKQAYLKAAIDLYILWKTHGEGELPPFSQKVIDLALEIKKKMNHAAPSGDILPTAQEVDTLNLGDIFGPGTTEVPNGL